jgi:branched-chain amino acid transport system substrate-binding protein
MSELLRGTVTFLFTDIEESTLLLRALGDGYGDVLATHRRLLREAGARHGGHEIDAQGDSTFAAFATARDALRAAIDGQAALTAHPWPDGAAVRVRMGLHTAEPTVSDGAYVGLGVHRAARICAAARGGQILASGATRSVLVEHGPPGPALRDLGARRLKGLGEPERLYEVTAGAAGPPRRGARGRRPPAVTDHTRRAAWVAAAAVVLAAAAVLLLVTRGGGPGVRALVPADAVGAIDPSSGRVVATAPVGAEPRRLAAAGGTLWAAAGGSAGLAAVDVHRRAVALGVAAEGRPGDVATGLGSVWTIDERGGRLLELSPAYRRVVRRFRLPRPRVPPELVVVRSFNPWAVAIGAGAVWVTNGSSRLLRLDPRTGARTEVAAGRPLDGVAVAGSGVWAISGRHAVAVRIDPRRARATDRIPIASRPGFDSPYPIAVEAGLGSVWVLNANTATVTRIDPVQRLITGTIPIGIDHQPVRLAVGAGAVWVAGADGTLSRIDPVTNAVTTRATVARRLNDIAVAGGAVWVSATRGFGGALATTATAGKAQTPTVQPLPASSCSPLNYRPGDRPRLLIASDLPLQTPDPVQGGEITAAIRFVLAERGFRAGRHAVAYQACDSSTPTPDVAFLAKCAPNARAYARDPSLVAVVGSFGSDCTRIEVPILNRAPGGPIAEISPSSTYVGLTRAGPGATVGEPERYAPTGRRSFLRTIPTDDVQGAADAQRARNLGVHRAYVLVEDSGYGRGVAAAFRRAAARLGAPVAGTAPLEPRDGFAHRVRASGADGVFLAGTMQPFGPRIIRALRRALPAGTPLIAPDGFATAEGLRQVGPAADGLEISVPGPPVSRLPPAGARFAARFGAAIGRRPEAYSVYAAQATEILLGAIARSDGTRASILHALFAARVRDGILGSFSFTPRGDITGGTVTIYRYTQGTASVERVITPPARLVGG